MIEKINSLLLQGEFFDTQTKLDFFVSSKNRCALVYGKNGCGKSTVARAVFQESAVQEQPSFSINQWLDDQGDPVVFSDVDKQHIFVFDEDYIDKNLKLSQDKDGMHAIVLFGKASALDAQIATFQAIIDEERAKISTRKSEQYSDPDNPNSLVNQKEEIKKTLQNAWAIRDQKIRKGQRRTPVNDVFLEEAINSPKSPKTMVQLQKEFDDLLDKTSLVSPNQTLLPTFQFSLTENTDASLAQLLNISFEIDTQDELVKKILESISRHGAFLADFTKDHLAEESICPVCFQPISLEHKKRLASAIKQVFNDETERVKQVLSSSLMSNVVIDVSPYFGFISGDILQKIQKAAEDYNKIIANDNDLINQKISNVRKSLNVSLSGLDQSKKTFSETLDLLNEKISEHNETIANYDKEIIALHDLNKAIAVYEIDAQNKTYHANLTLASESLKGDQESEKAINENTQKIEQLNQQKKNYSIALSEINRELACIFASKKRLFLKEGDDPSKYYIYSNGHKIRLNKLSVGERNIIALCYFFESIKENSTQGNYFTGDSLVVLDDPISSFDFENKLGIYSYLKGVLNDILHNNNNSKILLFSHELDVIIALDKVVEDIGEGSRVDRCFSLGNQIINLNTRKFSNYSSLLFSTFEFANSDLDSPDDETIGNTIRKALEAYANFNYKCSMDDFITKDEYLAKISDKALRTYFQKRMYRLVMNSASHTEDVAHQLPDLDLFDSFSPEEQRLTAKEVLVFMYCIDPEHIERHFSSNTGAIRIIERWREDILERIS